MLRNAQTAVKFFAYGIIVGIVFAPNNGAETRRQILSWVGDVFEETLGNVTGGGSGNQNP
jgi:hypothetical protein